MTDDMVRQTGKNKPTKEVAEAIKRTRIHNGFNQTNFARYLKVNLATVGRWERAETAPTRRVIAEIMMIAPEDLIGLFEDYTGKTKGQHLKERRDGLAGLPDPKVEDWSKNPREFCEKIAGATYQMIERILTQARSYSRDSQDAAESLFAILNFTTVQMEKVSEVRAKLRQTPH